jgi:hypothetical protein
MTSPIYRFACFSFHTNIRMILWATEHSYNPTDLQIFILYLRYLVLSTLNSLAVVFSGSKFFFDAISTETMMEARRNEREEHSMTLTSFECKESMSRSVTEFTTQELVDKGHV